MQGHETPAHSRRLSKLYRDLDTCGHRSPGAGQCSGLCSLDYSVKNGEDSAEGNAASRVRLLARGAVVVMRPDAPKGTILPPRTYTGGLSSSAACGRHRQTLHKHCHTSGRHMSVRSCLGEMSIAVRISIPVDT